MNPHKTFADFFTKEKEALHPFLYFLSKKLSEGNVCLDIDENNAEEEEEVRIKIDKTTLSDLQNHPLIAHQLSNVEPVKPFIISHNKLYLQRYFSYESKIVNGIKALIKNERIQDKQAHFLNNKKLTAKFKALFEHNKSTHIDWQMVACLIAYLQNFTIIAGGPGTGKTTTVAKMVALMLSENPDLTIKMAAPTGKAAARLKESLQNAPENKLKEIEPITIHKLLGIRPNTITPKHNADNTLHADVLIIDECSMIDISLFAKLISAIDITTTKLILLGDSNQLSSVGAGSLFGDLCTLTAKNIFNTTTGTFLNQFLPNDKQLTNEYINDEIHHPIFQHNIELMETHRFKDDDAIGIFSQAIINEDDITVSQFINENDIVILGDSTKDEQNFTDKDWLQYFSDKVKNEICHPDLKIENALQNINNSKILCATHQGNNGVQRIAGFIVNQLDDEAFANHHHLIMIQKNMNELQLSNGDIAISDSKNIFLPNKNESNQLEKIPISYLSLNDYTQAYAMTIHKSQGSEFEEVLILLPNHSDSDFITKELLYTAVTRAKKRAIIISNKSQLNTIIHNKVNRISGINHHWS